jgi:hypothetical protein
MSSAYSYLSNQNTKFVKTVTVPAFQTSTTSWMVTVHPIPSFCKICKITLISSAAPGSGTINLSVLNDGAGWRAASGNSAKAPFIVGTGSSTMAANIATFTFTGGLYYEDAYRTNCLYLNFSNSSFANGDTFTVTVEGIEMAPYKVDHTETTPFLGDNSWRILRRDASNNITDLTQKLMRNGNPYGIGSTLENSESFLSFDTSSDYLYIGSVRPWSNALFLVPSGSQNSTAVTFATYDGSAFNTTTSIQDNTSAAMNTASSLSYSGVIKVTSWTGAVPSRLSFDPLDELYNDYEDFTQNIPRPGGFFYYPTRYWLRMKFASITPSDLKLVGILPVR